MKIYCVSLIFLALAVSLSGCGGGGDVADSEEAKVIEAYEAAWNAQDIDGVMALYAEDAVEKNGLGTFMGQSQIRGVLVQAMKTFSLDCGNYKLSGNTLTYDCATGGGTETYDAVIENGKIKSNILTGTK